MNQKFRLAQRGQVQFLEATDLAALGFAVHAFCTRHSGVSPGDFASLNVGDTLGDDEKNVIENIDIIKRSFGIPADGLVMLRQKHRDGIVVIDEKDALPRPVVEGDGLITQRHGIALCIKTADCVPMLFVDSRQKVVGAIHAGWRGTALNIAAKMARVFSERFCSRRQDILVFIGPSIGPCCYEVGANVFDAFSGIKGRESFFHKLQKKDHWAFDLPHANRFQLVEEGIPDDHIQASGICTSCREDLFFSHRRAKGCNVGRQLSFVMLFPTVKQPLKKTLDIL